MKIVFTLHAKEQIEERKIHVVWVEETIKSPDKTNRIDHKYYAVKRLNGKTLKVVYTKEEGIKIITAFFL